MAESIIMWWSKKKKPEFKDSDFEILHYPLSGLYCPKYKGYYLRKTYPTNIIYTEDYYVVASYCKSKEEAERLIDLFKEQSLNINIKKLDYVSKNKN